MACVLFVRRGPFWSEGGRMNQATDAVSASSEPKMMTGEEFVQRAQAKEMTRHEARMVGLERMRARLLTKSSKKKNSSLPPREAALMRLFEQRNEIVEDLSEGYYADAHSREWKRIPLDWRKAFLVKAGIGMDVTDLTPLASRSWQEFPPPERDAVRAVIREVRAIVPKLFALGGRL